MASTYTCDACGGTFTEGWSDAEANAEARAVFGVDHDQDPTMARVCDDCYKTMVAALPPTTVLGIPIRLDSTLCDPAEIWIECPDGTAVKV